MTDRPKVAFTRVGDMDPSEVKHKCLVYAESGAGKTHLIATAPDVFVVVTERQAIATIRRSNPDAQIVYVDTAAKLREVLRMAVHDELKALGCRVLALDGLTEIQQLFKDEILASGDDPEAKRKADMTKKDWGTLTDKMRKFLRMLRDLPYDIVCTALSEVDQPEGSSIRYVQPSFQGRKLSNEVAQYFSVVGYVVKREVDAGGGGKETVRKVMVDGPQRFVTKSSGDVRGMMNPNLTEWFELLDAEVAKNTPKKSAKAGK